MAEYIEREALIADIENRYCRPCEAEGKDHHHVMCRACWVDDMVGEIGDAPFADVVPVVRCKDCIHWWDRSGVCLKIYDDGDYKSNAWQGRNADDFCSYGERRDAP